MPIAYSQCRVGAYCMEINLITFIKFLNINIFKIKIAINLKNFPFDSKKMS